MTILLNEPVAANSFAVALPMPGPVVLSVVYSLRTSLASVAYHYPKRQEHVLLTTSFDLPGYCEWFERLSKFDLGGICMQWNVLISGRRSPQSTCRTCNSVKQVTRWRLIHRRIAQTLRFQYNDCPFIVTNTSLLVSNLTPRGRAHVKCARMQCAPYYRDPTTWKSRAHSACKP